MLDVSGLQLTSLQPFFPFTKLTIFKATDNELENMEEVEFFLSHLSRYASSSSFHSRRNRRNRSSYDESYAFMNSHGDNNNDGDDPFQSNQGLKEFDVSNNPITSLYLFEERVIACAPSTLTKVNQTISITPELKRSYQHLRSHRMKVAQHEARRRRTKEEEEEEEEEESHPQESHPQESHPVDVQSHASSSAVSEPISIMSGKSVNKMSEFKLQL